jgi:hypothetical protein
MAIGSLSGFHDEAAGVLSSTKKFGTIPAGSFVTKISVQGYVTLAQVSVTLTNGQYAFYNLYAGVQYGVSGYTVVPLTDGGAEGANWWELCTMMPPIAGNQYLAGASPISYVLDAGFAISIDRAPYIYCAVATDVYGVIGCDASKSFAADFESYYNWYVEYAY